MELEKKVASLSASKEQYKNKWREAIGELALHHKQKHDTTRDRLASQERDLAKMRMHYMQQDEESSLNVQIAHVKDDVKQ